MVFDRDQDPIEFGRVLALSDGVFAIALTLLVLDLALPQAAGQGGLADDLVDAGRTLSPSRSASCSSATSG